MDDILVEKEVSLLDITNAVDGDIDNIIPLDGTRNVFPATMYVAPPAAIFSVPDISDFEWVKFADGDIEITIENKLPVAVTIDADLKIRMVQVLPLSRLSKCHPIKLLSQQFR